MNHCQRVFCVMKQEAGGALGPRDPERQLSAQREEAVDAHVSCPFSQRTERGSLSSRPGSPWEGTWGCRLVKLGGAGEGWTTCPVSSGTCISGNVHCFYRDCYKSTKIDFLKLEMSLFTCFT